MSFLMSSKRTGLVIKYRILANHTVRSQHGGGSFMACDSAHHSEVTVRVLCCLPQSENVGRS